ncbi:MAG: hypothetical protein H8E54_01750 [Candidatus Aminicenantes bacterium]|nr:hypothetical protein [Candidatus Aminicenantes bacterium]
MIFRVTIRDRYHWRGSIPAASEFEAMKEAVRRFREERDYEPASSEDILIAPDIEQFLS